MIETGRYVRPYKRPEERICPIYKKDVEDEIHFLTLCPAYQEKRSTLFEYLNKEYRKAVNRMAPGDVFLLLINPPSKRISMGLTDRRKTANNLVDSRKN